MTGLGVSGRIARFFLSSQLTPLIAIVLVIIGLLLGGVLKGQELITGARVRNLISQQDGIKAAFFGFQDRYRALPGDYAAASTNIAGVNITGDGNADLMISPGPSIYGGTTPTARAASSTFAGSTAAKRAMFSASVPSKSSTSCGT